MRWMLLSFLVACSSEHPPVAPLEPSDAGHVDAAPDPGDGQLVTQDCRPPDLAFPDPNLREECQCTIPPNGKGITFTIGCGGGICFSSDPAHWYFCGGNKRVVVLTNSRYCGADAGELGQEQYDALPVCSDAGAP